MIVVHNPTEAAVPNYPIQDPATKEVLLWTIGPGETLEFPDYVGKYLLEVYGFLQEVLTEDQVREREQERKKISEGRVYSQVKVVRASGEVIDQDFEEAEPEAGDTPAPQVGFTNANSQPHGEDIATPPVEAPDALRPFVCKTEGCGVAFKQENHLRVHFGLKHAVLPS